MPARILLALFNINPQNTLWVIGENLKIKRYSRMPDGKKLLFRPLTWDHEGIKEVYGGEEYEQKFKIKKGAVIVDAGAHIGIFTVKAAGQIGEQGKVVAVEPNAENFNLLSVNREINKLTNVVTVNAAISDYDGKASLYSRTGHSGGFSIVEQHSQSSVSVEVFTLDDLLSQLGINRIDFLKIDAEGAELQIIKGGSKVLSESDAKIVVAAYHPEDDPQEITRVLESFGFKTKITSESSGYGCFVYGWKPNWLI
jgi:FkbM family methyltransferase